MDDLAQSIAGVRGLAAMLRRLRADRDFTQEQLATRLAWPVKHVIDLENARKPKPSLLTISLLAYGCEVSVSLLVASFSLPIEEPLPWPREHRPLSDPPHVRLAGPQAFGATLREERYRLNWKQAYLAQRAGLRPQKVSEIERGRVAAPALLTVARLARGLADTTPRRIAHAAQLAQSYAGEIAAPRLRRISHPDVDAPPAAPD